MSATYLFQRRQGWYVRKKIPKDLQPIFKKKLITRSLKTRDKVEAERRKYFMLAEIEQEFEQARNPSKQAEQGIESLRATAKWLREEQQLIPWTHELEPHELMAIALESAEDITIKEIPEVNHLIHLASHPDDYSLEESIRTYLTEKEGNIRKSSYNSKLLKLDEFSKWAGNNRTVSSVTKKEASQYLSTQLMTRTSKAGEKLAISTIQGYINVLKAFFEWAEGRDMTKDNPFRKVGSTLRASSSGAGSKKVKGWRANEVALLLETVKTKDNKPLAALMLLAMYTGARGNEIAEMKIDDVTSWSLKVQGDPKNINSLRNIPIHSKIKNLVDKLIESSTDGYLVSGLSRGGEDDKRFHNIGKRFGTMKKGLGFTGRDKVFHSYRHTLVTLLHNAGEPSERIAGAIGHSDNRDFTLDTYSDGLENEEAIKVIEKANYGSEVNVLVVELVESISN